MNTTASADKKIRFLAAAVFAIAAVAATAVSVSGQSPILTYSPVRAALVALYYFFLYTGKWFNIVWLFLSAAAFWLGRRAGARRPGLFAGRMPVILFSTAAVLVCFGIVVLRVGNIGVNRASERTLYAICLCWWLLLVCYLAGGSNPSVQDENEKRDRTRDSVAGAAGAVLLLVLACIPVVYAGRYVFPQSDDFSYAAYSYWALQDGAGIGGVIGAAARKVAECYVSWQGTFSSIFLMALQPGIWGDGVYHAVPFLLILLLCVGVFAFFGALLGRWCKSKKEAVITAALVCLLAVLRPVSKASAFFWFNGAIHYLGAFSFLLLFLACELAAFGAKRGKQAYLALACFFGALVGGGNLVSGLMGCVLVFYLGAILCCLKQKDRLRLLLLPGLILLLAFAVNVLAPGNLLRANNSGDTEPLGVFLSVLGSFVCCARQMFGEWTDWYFLLLLLFLRPVLQRAARRTSFDFPLPGAVLFFSFCLLSAMYTPSLFAVGTARIGRIENIMYFSFLILGVLNEWYLLGWGMKRRGLCPSPVRPTRNFAFLCAIAVVFVGLSVSVDPSETTSTAAVSAVRSGEAWAWAEVVQSNLRLLEQSEEEEVILRRPPEKPDLFCSNEIDKWRNGTAEYYRKKKVLYEEEAGS